MPPLYPWVVYTPVYASLYTPRYGTPPCTCPSAVRQEASSTAGWCVKCALLAGVLKGRASLGETSQKGVKRGLLRGLSGLIGDLSEFLGGL